MSTEKAEVARGAPLDGLTLVATRKGRLFQSPGMMNHGANPSGYKLSRKRPVSRLIFASQALDLDG